MGAKLSWCEAFRWAAISALVFIVFAVMINIAMPGVMAGMIGFYALGVFTANVFVYRYDLYRMLPK